MNPAPTPSGAGGAALPVTVFALTPGGAETARTIASALGGELRLPRRMATTGVAGPAGSSAGAVDDSAGTFSHVGPALRDAFNAGSALVCVMAAGVVVRSLAPVLMGKHEDPPVLVVDELGEFVVPILSGHVGGGNALARQVAATLGARAVLTTSSDVQGLLGPDMLAVALDAHVEPAAALLPVAAALARGDTVDVWFDPATIGSAREFLLGLSGYRARPLPAAEGRAPAALAAVTSDGLEPSDAADSAPDPPAAASVLVSEQAEAEVPEGGPLGDRVRMIPRWIVAGVGCTRGTSRAALVTAVEEAFFAADIRLEALRALASVRAKESETGLLAAAEELGVPVVFAGDEAVEAEIAARGLAESEWVRASIGVGAASEPAALWAAGRGSVLVREKIARAGITVALARCDGGSVVAAREDRWKV